MGGSQSTQNETDTTQITLENDDKGEVTITKRRLSQEELTEMKDVLKESEDTFSIDPDLLKAIGKELGYTEEDYDDYEEEDEEEDEYEIHDLVSPIEMPENYPVFPGLSQESLSAIEFKPAPFVDFLDEQEVGPFQSTAAEDQNEVQISNPEENEPPSLAEAVINSEIDKQQLSLEESAITPEVENEQLSLKESAITPEVENEQISLEESIIPEVAPEACEAVSYEVNQPLSYISDDTDEVNMEVDHGEGGTYEMIADVESSDVIYETDPISPSPPAEPELDVVHSQITTGVNLSGPEIVLTDEDVTDHATEDTETLHSVDVEMEAELEDVEALAEEPVEKLADEPVAVEELVEKQVEESADEPVAVEELVDEPVEELVDAPVEELTKAVVFEGVTDHATEDNEAVRYVDGETEAELEQVDEQVEEKVRKPVEKLADEPVAVEELIEIQVEQSADEPSVLAELVDEPVEELTKAVVFEDPVQLISTEKLYVGVTSPTEDIFEADISADVDEISSDESDISEPKQDKEDTKIEEVVATESDVSSDLASYTESTEMTSSITEEDDKPGTEDPTLPPAEDLNPAEIVSGTDPTEVDPSEDIQVAENTPESVEETVVSEVLSEADVVSSVAEEVSAVHEPSVAEEVSAVHEPSVADEVLAVDEPSVAEEVSAVDEPSVTDEVLAVDEPSVTEEVIVGEEQSEPEEPVAEYEPSALEVAVTEEVASEEIIAHVEPSEPADVKTEETPAETLSEEEVPEDEVSPSPIEDQATISDADDLVLVVGEPHVEEEKSGADEPQPVVESVDNVTPEEPCEVCDLEEEVSGEPLLTPAVDPVLVEEVVPVEEAELVEVVSPVDNSVPVDPEVLEEPEEGISSDLQQLPEPEIQLEETPSETEVEIPVPDEKFTQEEPISVEIPAVEEEAVIAEEEEPSAPGFVASLFQKALEPFYGKLDEGKELENEKEPEIAVSEVVVEPEVVVSEVVVEREIAISEVVAQLEMLPPVVEDALEETVEDKDEVQLVEEVPAVTEEVPLVVEEFSPSVEPPKEDVEAKVLSQSENLADSLFGEFKKQEVEKIIAEAKLEGARGQAKLDADVMSNAINAERSRWRSRFNVIENNLQKRKHDICDANERGVSIVSSKLSIPESRETCTDTVSEIVECYTKNPTQVLHCQEIAQSFDSCVSKALVSR